MDDRDERLREVFPTETEAYAFIKGIEYFEQIKTDGPEIELDSEGQEEYAVYIGEFNESI